MKTPSAPSKAISSVVGMDPSTLLGALELHGARRRWIELARRAAAEGWSREDFLVMVLREELAHRRQG